MKENLKRLFTGCLTVPNLLSLIRIILIPVFGVLFYHDHVLAAVIVLAVSGLTDLFDGKIARRFNQVSELGKILDPIADKLTQMTIAIVLFLEFNKSTNPTMKWFKWVFLFFIAKRIAYGACRCNYDRHRSSPECSGNVGQGCDNGILWCYDSCYCIRTGSRSSQSVFYTS